MTTIYLRPILHRHCVYYNTYIHIGYYLLLVPTEIERPILCTRTHGVRNNTDDNSRSG